jgi:methyl-accepting chemotaxis protein
LDGQSRVTSSVLFLLSGESTHHPRQLSSLSTRWKTRAYAKSLTLAFAVVASEVRSLAQRSAVAAREIKALIAASVENVESGTRVVQGAGQAMTQLSGHATRMNNLLGEISTASQEQRSGVAQIGSSVQQLDTMTQQNAALVEQIAAAASSLRDQALGLARAVNAFKL